MRERNAGKTGKLVVQHRIWLGASLLIALILISVIILYVARPQALFGKAVAYQRGNLVAQDLQLTAQTTDATTVYTGQFSYNQKGYVVYRELLDTKGFREYMCSCVAGKCPSFADCRAQYSEPIFYIPLK